MSQNNLDYLCAKYGQDVVTDKAKENESLIQKTIGVLQKDGLLAFIIYLESKKDKDKEIVDNILDKSASILNEIGLTQDANKNNIREKIHGITKDIDNIDSMFLSRDLLERMLIYALYRAKALSPKLESE